MSHLWQFCMSVGMVEATWSPIGPATYGHKEVTARSGDIYFLLSDRVRSVDQAICAKLLAGFDNTLPGINHTACSAFDRDDDTRATF
jgi:hypothetical protein